MVKKQFHLDGQELWLLSIENAVAAAIRLRVNSPDILSEGKMTVENIAQVFGRLWEIEEVL